MAGVAPPLAVCRASADEEMQHRPPQNAPQQKPPGLGPPARRPSTTPAPRARKMTSWWCANQSGRYPAALRWQKQSHQEQEPAGVARRQIQRLRQVRPATAQRGTPEPVRREARLRGKEAREPVEQGHCQGERTVPQAAHTQAPSQSRTGQSTGGDGLQARLTRRAGRRSGGGARGRPPQLSQRQLLPRPPQHGWRLPWRQPLPVLPLPQCGRPWTGRSGVSRCGHPCRRRR